EQALGIFVASSTSHNRTSAAIGDAFPGAARRVREEVPFSSERKWSGLILDDPGGGAYVLGAPESLESALSDGRGMDDGRVGAWTAQGLRVLLFAFGPGVTTFSDPEAPNLPKHLVPLGLIALRDELRQDAGETLRAFAGAGIALKIISGDHPATVTTLARQAGVEVKEDEQVITGLDLDGLDERGYERVADDAMIFARVSPSQKEKLVTALQRRGRYVAMIGDGVNDVPALKHANVAVAMRSGSDVARGIADLVLLDDAFTKLPATFHEGQRVRNGLRTTMNLFFTRTLYTILIVLVTALGGAAFPIPLRHGALVSALAVGLPAFALTIWARPGKVARRALPEVFDVVVPAGVTIAAMGLAVYHVFLAVTDDIDLAQSALTTMTMLCGFALIPFLRPPTKAWVGATGLVGDWRPTFFAGLMLIVFLGVLFVPPMQVFWELEPLPLWTYPAMVLVVPLWALTVRLLWRSCLMKRLRQFGSTGWRALVVTNTHQKPRRMTTS
ncbi:MAG: HAD-IC family P-type ATPase, partial [Dehalococcoidia bacterium]